MTILLWIGAAVALIILIIVLSATEDDIDFLIGPPPCICDKCDDQFDCDGKCKNKPYTDEHGNII